MRKERLIRILIIKNQILNCSRRGKKETSNLLILEDPKDFSKES